MYINNVAVKKANVKGLIFLLNQLSLDISYSQRLVTSCISNISYLNSSSRICLSISLNLSLSFIFLDSCLRESIPVMLPASCISSGATSLPCFTNHLKASPTLVVPFLSLYFY